MRDTLFDTEHERVQGYKGCYSSNVEIIQAEAGSVRARRAVQLQVEETN
jgi:hypothetical protein